LRAAEGRTLGRPQFTPQGKTEKISVFVFSGIVVYALHNELLLTKKRAGGTLGFSFLHCVQPRGAHAWSITTHFTVINSKYNCLISFIF